MSFGKWLVVFLTAVALVAVALSWLFGVAYYYTFLGFLFWIVLGHLGTIDDEEPEGWSNPEGSKEIWHSSLKELGIKAVVLSVAFAALLIFPSLHEFGAN